MKFREHIYDVDAQSGFMPPREPLARLPGLWEPWETVLDAAIRGKLQLGDKPDVTDEEKAVSESWRGSVRRLPLLPVTDLQSSPNLLRRSHLVLTYIMHFYIHSLPPDAPLVIPQPLALPVLRVSAWLDIPPILTFSDTVLYNWMKSHPSTVAIPTIDNLRTRTMFTGLIDEEEFYLCSARIELRGADALDLMGATMNAISTGDETAARRIAGHLQCIAAIIKELRELLMAIRKGCRPDQYYNDVRPWLRGEDSDENRRKWIFEGIEQDPSLEIPKELCGPSAGQSSMVHVLDVFLGIDHQPTSPGKRSYMSRMQSYMPRSHRLLLDHLSCNPQPLRAFVMSSANAFLLESYNLAVVALKDFRDAHMIITALYILGPARKAGKRVEITQDRDREPLRGTGGTHLVKFLKDTRARTSEAII
ncbi:hypothetical protein H0H92_005673 [Tricholoma furcatifolium]|nr:hypothetical protein H0H92_005673 [Tricholoma furcatifolium]